MRQVPGNGDWLGTGRPRGRDRDDAGAWDSKRGTRRRLRRRLRRDAAVVAVGRVRRLLRLRQRLARRDRRLAAADPGERPAPLPRREGKAVRGRILRRQRRRRRPGDARQRLEYRRLGRLRPPQIPTGNIFHQVSGGVEALGEIFDLRANGYLPINDSEAVSSSSSSTGTVTLQGSNIVIVTDTVTSTTSEIGRAHV